ncbi:Protein of unknown function [Lactobacillus equicursoris 66c]|nr:Protein of unknown function [Lactobacillus equicursoris 66c]
MDAIAISGIKSVGQMPETVTMISQFRKKKRSLHEAIARKGRKQCRLIMHNGNWQKAEQKLSLYEFK